MSGLLKQKDNKFHGIYRGKVLDNNDPDKYGRLKIQVYPMMSELIAEELPWSKPAMPIFEGAGLVTPDDVPSGGIGSFIVPKINTYLFVFFEAGDIYSPVFFAEAPTATRGLPTIKDTNYPNRKVLRTRSGIEIYLDTQINEIKVLHPTGTFITITETGGIIINVAENVVEQVDGNVDVHVDGNITVTSDSNIIIQGADVHINP